MPAVPLWILEGSHSTPGDPAVDHKQASQKAASSGSVASPGRGAISLVTLQPGRPYQWWCGKMTEPEPHGTVNYSLCPSTSGSLCSGEYETKKGVTTMGEELTLISGGRLFFLNRQGRTSVALRWCTWMPLAPYSLAQP